MNSEYSQSNRNEENSFSPNMDFMTKEQYEYYESTVQLENQQDVYKEVV